MAITISGVSVCAICGLNVYDRAYLFPAFAPNKLDVLARFSDSVVHQACLSGDPQALDAVRFCDLGRTKSQSCASCGMRVSDPDGLFVFGYLTSDIDHPAYEFNGLGLHSRHFWSWSRAIECKSALELLFLSGWEGPVVDFTTDGLVWRYPNQ
jgi:hypothetical protein